MHTCTPLVGDLPASSLLDVQDTWTQLARAALASPQPARLGFVRTEHASSPESPRTRGLWQLVRAPLAPQAAKSACGLTLGLCPLSVLASRLLHLLAS